MASNLRVETLLDTIPECDSLLDIGCVQHDAETSENDDWLHAELYDRADEVLGVDRLPDDVKALQDAGYDVVCADAERLDLDREFEVIVAGELIEHLSNVGQFLSRVRWHLQPEGRFILSTPNPWAFHRFRQALFNGGVRCNPEHTAWFDERTLRQVLKRHGFAVKSVDYVRPSTGGITRYLYDLGFETIGGTSLVVTARRAS